MKKIRNIIVIILIAISCWAATKGMKNFLGVFYFTGGSLLIILLISIFVKMINKQDEVINQVPGLTEKELPMCMLAYKKLNTETFNSLYVDKETETYKNFHLLSEQDKKYHILSLAGEDLEKVKKKEGKTNTIIKICLPIFTILVLGLGFIALRQNLRKVLNLKDGVSIMQLFSSKSRLIATTKEIKVGNVLQIGNSKVQTIEGIVAAVFISLGTGGTVATLKEEMEWKIEGNRGKDRSVVLVTYNGAEARILVEKQGDYYMIENLARDIEFEYKNQRYNIIQFITM